MSLKDKILNPGQLEAVRHKSGPLLIVAGAGTGKTTVVTERIKWLINQDLAKPEEILALTFTEKAAREMEERVDQALPYGTFGMWIMTFHSFCDRILRSEALHIGLNPHYRLLTEAETYLLVKNNFWKFSLNYFRPSGNPYKFIAGMIQHFSRLKDEDVSVEDYLKFAEKDVEEKEKTPELANAFKVYEELKSTEGVMDFADLISNTLKLFRDRKNILARYQKQFKYILVDEFQDTNFAQNEMVKLLTGDAANVTVVADDDQCLPAGTMIDTLSGKKKIEDVRLSDSVISAVGRGHLSTEKVVKIDKNIKQTTFVTLTTASGIKIRATYNHKFFCMIPGRKFSGDQTFYVYLMFRSDMGWRLGITNDLSQRLKLERSADKIIAIKAVATLIEARFYEATLSLQYQIPTYPFKPRRQMILTEDWLGRLFSTFPTEENARKLASDLGIDLQSHHYCLGGVVRGTKERVKVILSMCTRRYRAKKSNNRILLSPKVLHAVVLETSSLRIKELVEKKGIDISKAKTGWRARKYFARLEDAGNFAKKLEEITGAFFEARFVAGQKNNRSHAALVMPVSNIFEGMYVPIKKGNTIIYDRVISRKTSNSKETVYDLEVENAHNFIANGVVVHNSIYRFRGAAVSNVLQFRRDFPKAAVITLTTNYRSTQEILDRAYDLIQHNNPDRLEVAEHINKKLESRIKNRGDKIEFIYTDRAEQEAESVINSIKQLSDKYQWSDFAILVRANNHSEPFVRALERARIPYQFLGPGMLFRQSEVKDLIAYLKVLYDFTDSVSLYRVLSMNTWGISQRDLIGVLNYGKRLNLSLFETLEKLETPEKVQPLEKVEPFLKFVSMVHRHQELISKESAGQILFYFLEDSGLLKSVVEYKTQIDEKRALNITKFFDKLKSFESTNKDASVFAVVDYLDLAMDMGESPLAAEVDWSENNAVNILTVHSAKGLEFPTVFLVNLAEGRFPSRDRKEQIPIPEELIKEVLPKGDFHLEEERRLFYVGMTRAKDHLFFSAANYYGEGKRERKLSPFVVEALGNISHKPVSESDEKQLALFEWAKPKEENKTAEPSTTKVDYLSYSAIQAFKECPLHFKLRYILRIPTPTTAPLSMGNSTHLALRDFYRQDIHDKKTLLDLLDKNWEPLGYTSKKHEAQAKEKAARFLSEYLETELHKTAKPLLLEQPFTIKIDLPAGKQVPPLKIGGKIDRVDDRGGGKIEIIDYKTGANVPTQKDIDLDLQMTIYALAATEVLQKPIDKVRLSFYYFDNANQVTTVRTKEQLEEAKKQLLSIRDAIEKSDFACSGNILCQNCEFKMLCGG